MDTSTPPTLSDDSHWPMKSILFIGYFGNKTPEGRRFHNRSMGALLVLLFLSFLTIPAALWLPLPLANVYRFAQILVHILMGGAFSFIAWSFWKYVKELDELTRGMQLQAVCLAYLTGMSVLPFVALLGIVKDWHIDPFIAFLMLEPVRAIWLWIIARRYQ